MFVNLSKRSDQPELMDSFEEPIASLRIVLQDINRVNQLLGGNKITVAAVHDLMKEQPQEHYSIVDMGCGDGQMLRQIADFCRKNNIKASFVGIDLNQNGLIIAEAASQEYPEIQFLQHDILKLKASTIPCDILISTLTMHHFTDEEVLVFLKKFVSIARLGVVINDLQRSAWAYYLFHLFSRIFIKTKIAKIDGLISIRRAFIKKELLTYAQELPEVLHQIEWKWAFRYVWVMKVPQVKEIYE